MTCASISIEHSNSNIRSAHILVSLSRSGADPALISDNMAKHTGSKGACTPVLPVLSPHYLEKIWTLWCILPAIPELPHETHAQLLV